MPDEQEGQPQIAENAPAQGAPVAAPTESAPGGQPASVIPAKYAGKTAEEMARMLDEQERMIGRQTQEVGELRQRAQSYENYLQQQLMAQQQAQTAQQQAPAPPEEPAGGWDWEKPERSVDGRVAQAEKRFKAEMDNRLRQLAMQTAMAQAPMAKELAKAQFPDAFRDITDAELDNLVYSSAARGIVDPTNLGSPKSWVMAAHLLRGEKTGYKYPAAGVNPVSPVSTEAPVGAKPQNFGDSEPVVLDDLARSMARSFGKSDADLQKLMREERKGR